MEGNSDVLGVCAISYLKISLYYESCAGQYFSGRSIDGLFISYCLAV